MKKITLFFMFLLSWCGFSQLPLQDFETWPLTGWGIYDNGIGTNQSWSASPLGNPFFPPFAGNHAAFMERENVPNTGDPAQDWLVTPSFVLPANPQLRFMTRTTAGGNQGTVYRILMAPAGADLTLLSSYTTVQTFTEPGLGPNWEEYGEIVVNLPGVAGQNYHIAFFMEGDNQDRWLVDNAQVVAQCLAPTGLGVNTVTATTANLTWSGVSAGGFEVEYLPAANAPTGSGDVVPTGNVLAVDDLVATTAYKFYVRALCGPGNFSEWAGPFNFSTPPVNDACSGAIMLTVNPTNICTVSTPGTIAAATASPEGNTCGGTDDDDVWYQFVATNTTHLINLNNITGGTTDLFHVLYSGSLCGSLTQLYCSDPNNSTATGLTVGQTYTLRVYSWTATVNQTSNFQVCIGTPPPPPVNDECIGAISVPVNPDLNCTQIVTATIFSATQSAQANTCGGTANDDVWFSFVATNPSHTINLNNVTGSTTDLFHGVYSGTCGGLTLMYCSDPNNSIAGNLTVGQTYYVRVYSWTATINQTSVFDVCIGTPPPPPANDNCAGAVNVPVNPNLTCTLVTPGTISWATQSLDANTCIGTANDDVWYSFVATNTAHTINFNNVVGNTDLVHAVYSGACGTMTLLTCNDPNNSLVGNLTVGQTYYIRVYTWTATAGQTSTFDVCIGTPPPPPANDNCATATVTPVNPTLTCAAFATGTIAWATPSIEGNTCFGTDDDDVWFEFVATNASHTINLNNITNGTTDLFHAVYSGNICGTLTQLYCSDPNNSIATGLTVGNTYKIRVYSWTSTPGQTSNFEVCVGTPPPPPANDNCAGALDVAVNPDLSCALVTPGTINWSTPSVEGNTCFGTDDDDVWFEFVATNPVHTINLNNVVGNTDLFHVLYSGDICGSMTQLYCSDPNNSVATGLVVGNTYKIRVYTWTSTSGQSSTFDVCVGTPPPPPANDNCATATPVPVNPTQVCVQSVPGTINWSTPSAEGNTCGGTDDDDVWYTFVATNTTHIISLNNVVGNTDLFHVLYSGSVCGSMTQLYCSDPNQSFATGLTVGQTYTIRVYTWTSTPMQSSTFEVCVGTPPPPPVNDNCAGAIEVPVNPDQFCNLTVPGTVFSASASTEPNTCATNQDDDDIWFEFTATNTRHTISLLNVTGSTTALSHVVYAGDICGTLTQVYCSTALTSFAEGLTIGQTYKVRVYTTTATVNQTSAFDICVATPPPPPVNDDCANATEVLVNLTADCINFGSGTIYSSTASPEPNACGGTDDDDVWFEFVAGSATHFINLYNVTGSTTDLFHVLYSGDICGSLTQIYCSDANNSTATGLTIGATYKVRVYSWTSTPNQTSAFDICIGTPTPPITVNTTAFTAEQLVEDVLISSECALVSNITSSTGSNFGQANGIGYFSQNGSNFPFADGVVLATHAATAAPGPYPGGADGLAASPPWGGDADLSAIIADGGNTGPLHNASILEFDFVPLINQISFRFLFASDEYGTFQCTFSDAFAFILTNLDDPLAEPINLAVIPNTTVPVSVVNIRDQQYNPFGTCGSANPEYFGAFNQDNPQASSTGYNGQTVVMTASGDVVPGTNYHIKLVIADYNDTAFNSAVFLEGGSFDLGEIDLGEDLVIDQGTAACGQDEVTLQTGFDADLYDFAWTVTTEDENGNPVTTPLPDNTPDLVVQAPGGIYNVVATFTAVPDCSIEGEVIVEFYPDETADPIDFVACDADGFATFDMSSNIDVMLAPVDDPADYEITFHETEADALSGDNDLPMVYDNIVEDLQTIYVRIVRLETGCVTTKQFNLVVEDHTPEFTITDDFNICVGTTDAEIEIDPINFDPASPDVTISWTLDGAPLPDTGVTITVTTGGVYEVTVNNMGCTATAATTVTVTPIPAVDDLEDVTACDEFILPALVNPNNAYYTAPAGGGEQLFAGEPITSSQTIYIYAESNTIPANCTAESDFAVIINPTPAFNLGGPYVVCDAEGVTIQVNAENFNTADATYAWTYEGTPVGGNTSSLAGVGYGNYEVTVTLDGCPATSSVAITQDTTPLAFNLGGPYVVCNPELAIITVNAENFDPADVTYAWTFDGNPVGGNTSSLQAVGFGNYGVTVTMGDCTGTGSIAVTENTEAFDLALDHGCDGTEYMIHIAPVEDENGNRSYDPDTATVSWTGPNGFTSSDADDVITEEGIYTVTVTTAEGCVSQGAIEVDNTSCLLPRGISPNNDGMNDNFDLSGFNVAKLSIFNRYGREVYSKTNYTNEWFGQTDGGDELPTGTYFFSMERANGESRTGWVYINRQEN